MAIQRWSTLDLLLGNARLVPGAQLHSSAKVEALGFASLKAGISRRIDMGDELSIALGFSQSLHLAAVFHEARASLDLEAGNALLPDSISHRLDSAVLHRSGRGLGLGTGFDLGLAIERRDDRLGIGVSDLLSGIYWPRRRRAAETL